MRLRHVYVEGCGRFMQPVSVTGLEPGLNVLAAPNEAGKSTLFKAIRACIFKKHTARDEDLRDLATQGASAPLTVEVAFEKDGCEYVARKTFLSSPRASLRRDGKEIAAGRAADEEIFEILGLKPGSGRNVDEGAYGMLWVAQSQSFAPPDVGGAVKNAIESAIEGEVGSLVGGDRARDLMKRLSDELASLFTPTGQVRKTGALGLAQERAQNLASELAQARDLLAALERDTDELERRRRQRDELIDPSVEAALRENLARAREEMRIAQEASRELASRAQAERLCAAERDEAARALKTLRETAARVDEAMELRARLADETNAEADRRRDLESRRDDARARLAELEETDTRDARAESHLRGLASVAAAMARLPDLEARLDLLAQAANELAAVKESLATNRATARHVQAIDKMDAELSQLRARLDAAATRIIVTPSQDPAAPIFLNGERIAHTTEFAATGRSILTIPGAGEINVAPPAAFGEAERKRILELEASRERTISDAGATNAESVRLLAEERNSAEAKLAAIGAKLAAIQSSEATLPGDIAALRERLAALRANIRQTLGEEDTALDAQVLADKHTALEARRRENAAARKALQASADVLGEDLTRSAEAFARKRAQIETLERQIETDLRLLPQAERPSRIALAGETFATRQRAWEAADLALQQAREKAPADEHLVQLAERVKRHETALANHSAELKSIEVAIGELHGRIQTRGGEGLGERVASLGEEAAVAERDAERLRARAASLTLLRDTIADCYEEQREQLQEPIRKRLQPFLNDLFPKAELTLDESFSVRRIVRAGSEESFTRLSDGTREQIAVLVRLAMGALLHERGEDVPIILDDALVFCDDDRMELMFDALNRAARTQQVIVLTCRGKSFRSLGGKALQIEPAAR
ncbi:MAG: AAA family ATPase [Beijerinckiaceae bacterium]